MRSLGILTVFLASACAHSGATSEVGPAAASQVATQGPTSPEAAVAAYFEVMRNPSVDGVWALMTAKDRAENDRKALEVAFAEATPEQRAETQGRYQTTPADIRITRKEDGKHASAFYVLGVEHCELELEDEGGAWKIGVETCESGG